MGILSRSFQLPLFAAASALLVGGARADACVLPVLVDGTGDAPVGWWTGDVAQAGALEAALLNSSSVWCADVVDGANLRPVSALLRPLEVTATNSVELAQLLGADRVLTGTVRRVDAPDVAWLGLFRTVFVVEGAVMDAASGAEIRPVSLRAVAFGQTAADADSAAAALLARFAAQSVMDVVSSGQGAWPSSAGENVLVLVGGPSAEPYVAARTALRDAAPGVVDLTEAWATEGAIGVRVALDEDATFAAFVQGVTRLEAVDLPEVRIADVEALESGDVLVSVEPAPVCEGCSVAPPAPQ